jgi:hypothetical protein
VASRFRDQVLAQALHELNFREGTTAWCLARVDSNLKMSSHILPIDDLRQHEAHDGELCWCRPELDEDGDLVHNALDGREAFETGERLPS